MIHAHNSLVSAFRQATSAFLTLNLLILQLKKKGLITDEDIDAIKKETDEVVTKLQSGPEGLEGPDRDASPKSTVLQGSFDFRDETGQPESSNSTEPVVAGNAGT